MNQNDTIKEATLVVNGEFPKKPSIIEKIKESKVIIATDGAANLLSEYEIHPHLSQFFVDSKLSPDNVLFAPKMRRRMDGLAKYNLRDSHLYDDNQAKLRHADLKN